MGIKKFVVNIEGDYVDSYIYSGYLALVDAKYRLTIYKWEELFDTSVFGRDSFQAKFLKELMSDSRKPIPKNSLGEIVLSKGILAKAERCVYDIGVWPTDINIYSNRMYISSENGIFKLDLDYSSGKLGNEIKLFGEMCFSLSPNSFGRLAFAAGKEGVLTLIPLSNVYNSSDVKQLISGVCVDIDWQSTKLLANTTNGVVEASFENMPNRSDFETKKDFYTAVKEKKSIAPKISIKDQINCSWIAGDKIYSIKNDNSLNIDSNESTIIRKMNLGSKLLRARTAAFGTIIETDDTLIALIGDDQINMASDPVSWRVFPRAKNYANQLHVIKDEHISITVIESRDNNDFGFDTEKIDTQG